MTETAKLIVRSIPPRLKGKIVSRVRARKSNLDDVMVEVLCRYYGVEFEPTGRPFPVEKIGSYPHVVLDAPVALKGAIDVDAAGSGETIRNVVVRILCDEFGVPFEPTGRWVKKRRAAAV